MSGESQMRNMASVGARAAETALVAEVLCDHGLERWKGLQSKAVRENVPGKREGSETQ